MKCLILAVGKTTRLYPLTENYHKPLLEVQGKTILNRLINDIDTLGAVDEYTLINLLIILILIWLFNVFAELMLRETILRGFVTNRSSCYGTVRQKI